MEGLRFWLERSRSNWMGGAEGALFFFRSIARLDRQKETKEGGERRACCARPRNKPRDHAAARRGGRTSKCAHRDSQTPKRREMRGKKPGSKNRRAPRAREIHFIFTFGNRL